jgi:hypothetical protein
MPKRGCGGGAATELGSNEVMDPRYADSANGGLWRSGLCWKEAWAVAALSPERSGLVGRYCCCGG